MAHTLQVRVSRGILFRSWKMGVLVASGLRIEAPGSGSPFSLHPYEGTRPQVLREKRGGAAQLAHKPNPRIKDI